jgi:8-oxo-dGTP pyrophosphatase MutT (NUDIX family)
MNRADIIVAWIPRQFPDMPAFSSNVELGEFFKSGKLLLGYTEGALKMGYITYRSNTWLRDFYKWQVPVYGSLKDTLQAAVDRIGKGALRLGVETTIPLDIWKDKTFQTWYGYLKKAHHRLEDFTVEYVFFRRQDENGRPKQKVWVARPKVLIRRENRRKDNEVVVGRLPTTSVLMYFPCNERVLDWLIVLVEEYRSAVMNSKGRVFELPGGTIEPPDVFHDEQAIRLSAVREVEEEVGGFQIDSDRLIPAGFHQGLATLVACENHLFTYELTEAEFRVILDTPMKDASLVGDNDEYTKVRITSARQILNGSDTPLDWVNIGMIMEFVAKMLSREETK